MAFRWFRRATQSEQQTLDWKAGGRGRGGTNWRYEVWYFAPFQTDVLEGAELLGDGLARLRTLGGRGVQQAAARAAARGGLAVVPEATELVPAVDPAAAAPQTGLAADQAEPNPWAAWRGPAAAATAREEERGVWF